EWDVPEPALLWNVGHRGGAFIDAGIAHGAFVIGPDGDLVELGVPHLPTRARERERVASGGVDGNGGVELEPLTGLVHRADSVDVSVLLDGFADGDLFHYLGALFASVVHQQLIELAAQDLPSIGGLVFEVLEEVEGMRGAPVRADELDAVLA